MVQMTMKSPQCTGTIKTRGKKRADNDLLLCQFQLTPDNCICYQE